MDQQVECLRCRNTMRFLKEYRFDSRVNNRGIVGTLFDREEHLIFEVYTCPQCRHTEFFYTGSVNR